MYKRNYTNKISDDYNKERMNRSVDRTTSGKKMNMAVAFGNSTSLLSGKYNDKGLLYKLKQTANPLSNQLLNKTFKIRSKTSNLTASLRQEQPYEHQE